MSQSKKVKSQSAHRWIAGKLGVDEKSLVFPSKRREDWARSDLTALKILTEKSNKKGRLRDPNFILPEHALLLDDIQDGGTKALPSNGTRISSAGVRRRLSNFSDPLNILHLAKPVVIKFEITQDCQLSLDFTTKNELQFILLEFDIAKGQSLNLTELYQSLSNQPSWQQIHMRFSLEQGAQLRRDIAQLSGACQLWFNFCEFVVKDDCEVVQNAYLQGAALARFQQNAQILGQNAAMREAIAYKIDGANHLDISALSQFSVPKSEVQQVVKGVVEDRAKASFSGQFIVESDAQKTDANMRHDALLLSEDARVFAKPQLEIYADDVACTHGNTIGALDEMALFYCQQRAISYDFAKSMLVRAFMSGHLPADFIFLQAIQDGDIPLI